MNEKKYYISGMHCPSCEMLVEKRVLKEKGVSFAEVSIGNETLCIRAAGKIPTAKELNEWFKEDGYSFSETKQKNTWRKI